MNAEAQMPKVEAQLLAFQSSFVICHSSFCIGFSLPLGCQQEKIHLLLNYANTRRAC
jgi:hypothetical protein